MSNQIFQLTSQALSLAFECNNHVKLHGKPCREAFSLARNILNNAGFNGAEVVNRCVEAEEYTSSDVEDFANEVRREEREAAKQKRICRVDEAFDAVSKNHPDLDGVSLWDADHTRYWFETYRNGEQVGIFVEFYNGEVKTEEITLPF